MKEENFNKRTPMQKRMYNAATCTVGEITFDIKNTQRLIDYLITIIKINERSLIETKLYELKLLKTLIKDI